MCVSERRVTGKVYFEEESSDNEEYTEKTGQTTNHLDRREINEESRTSDTLAI